MRAHVSLRCSPLGKPVMGWESRLPLAYGSATARYATKRLNKPLFRSLETSLKRNKMNGYEEHYEKYDMTAPKKHRAKLWDDAPVFN